jgi:hypothetical protein
MISSWIYFIDVSIFKMLLSSGLRRTSLIEYESLSQAPTPQLSVSSRMGTPQGSVPGPKSFTVYAEDATNIFMHNHVQHIFSDDMQGTKQAIPAQISDVAAELRSCISNVHDLRMSKGCS